MSKLHDLWLVLTGKLSSAIFEKALADKQAEANYLAKQLRKYDDKIFQMSQCTSWPQMQPIYADLLEECRKTVTKESERIADILIPELERIYGRE